MCTVSKYTQTVKRYSVYSNTKHEINEMFNAELKLSLCACLKFSIKSRVFLIKKHFNFTKSQITDLNVLQTN